MYGLSNIASTAAALFLLPLYVRFLSPSQYGVYEVLVVTAGIFSMLVQAGIATALFKAVHYDVDAGIDQPVLMSTALYFALFSSGLGLLVLTLAAPQIAATILGDSIYANAVRIFLIKASLDTLAVVPLAMLRIREQAPRYLAVGVFRIGLTIVLATLFLVVLRQGLQGLLYAALLESIIFTAVMVVMVAADLRFAFSMSACKRMLSFGLPLVPIGLALLVLSSADRYFLRHYTSLDEVGRYALGYKLAMVVALVVRSFQIAWPPVMFAAAKRGTAETLYPPVLTYFVLTLTLVALTIAVFAPEIVLVIGSPAYYGAAAAVPLIALGNVLYGAYVVAATGANVANRTAPLAVAVVGAALVNIVLNFLLIPPFRAMGAAAATALSYAVLAAASWAVSQRFHPVRYEWRRIVLVLGIAIVLAAIGMTLPARVTTLNLLLKLSVLTTLPVALYLVGFFNQAERRWINARMHDALLRSGSRHSARKPL